MRKGENMKKIIILIAFGLLFFAGTSHAKIHEMVKEAGDLTVKIVMEMEEHNESGQQESKDSSPHHSMGSNIMNIFLLDLVGNAVTDAKIKVGYSMTPMKNMPPMKYTARAKLHGEQYDAKVNFSMKGDWDVIIYVKRPNKPLAKLDFDVNVK